MTREELINSPEYKLRNLALEWWEKNQNEEIDAIDGYEAGYKEAIEHPTGGELLHVLNKGVKQGYKEAVNKIWEWLYSKYNENGYLDLDDVDELKKYMEEQA